MAEVEKILVDKKELDDIKYKNRDLILRVKEKSEDNPSWAVSLLQALKRSSSWPVNLKVVMIEARLN